MRVAAHLDIPFIEVDLSREYEREVFRPSIDEWKRGLTPNPDTLCNEKIKFGVFYDFCMSQGADVVATGHYAQAQDGQLFISADKNKDQSYFLWAVPETHVKKVMFPVGNLTKPEVRALAERFNLPNAARHDSQGLCFLGDISIDDMLAREVGHAQGDVFDEDGSVIGTHEGAAFYTLGQRHGFSLSHDSPDAKPQYVIAKDIARNTITVSQYKFPRDAKKTRIGLMHANWIGEVGAGACEARYRYRQELIPAAIISKEGDGAEVDLEAPQYVPLGQSLVLYEGDRCLGGGVIESATLLS